MDIATILGLIIAFGLVIGSIAAGGSIMAFVNLPAVLIVVGGTIGAVMIAYPMADVMGTLKVTKNAFFTTVFSPADTIKSIVELAGKARREGLLALESSLGEIKDPFLVSGLQFAVDGQDASTIEDVMYQEIESMKDRHKLGAEVLTTAGTFAPALGLVGTLVGLIQMLRNMDDPSSIGPSMAVALLTTLYGAVLANLIFAPMSGKLKTRSTMESQSKELVMAGVLAIAAGDNPRIIEQKLIARLPPGKRAEVTEGGKA